MPFISYASPVLIRLQVPLLLAESGQFFLVTVSENNPEGETTLFCMALSGNNAHILFPIYLHFASMCSDRMISKLQSLSRSLFRNGCNGTIRYATARAKTDFEVYVDAV